MAKSTPPWVGSSPTDPPYEVVYERLDNSVLDDFAQYYTAKRRLAPPVDQILATLELPVFRKIVERLYNDIVAGTTANDVRGQTGEIITSYILETKHNVFAFGLSWPVEPFLVRRGIDVAGVCTHSWLVVYAQSKTTATRDVGSQASKLASDLDAQVLDKKFRASASVNQSRNAAIRAVRQAVREDRLKGEKIGPSDIERIVSEDKFVRVGFMFHEEQASGHDYEGLMEKLRSDPGAGKVPTIIMDVTVNSLREVTEIAAFCEERANDE